MLYASPSRVSSMRLRIPAPATAACLAVTSIYASAYALSQRPARGPPLNNPENLFPATRPAPGSKPRAPTSSCPASDATTRHACSQTMA